MLEAASIIFSGTGAISILIGVGVGLVVGILPGLGQGVALMLTLPIVLVYPAQTSLMIYAALLGATTFGGSITSVILGVPGTAQNLTTLIDGYPMSREGHAGRAIGLCAFSSMVGALIGMVVVVCCIPFVRILIYAYGSREYFLTIILAAIVVSLVNNEFFKGLTAFCAGSMVAMVGCDLIYAKSRFTGGIFYLWSEIPIAVFIIGLFALTGLVMLQSDGSTISRDGILKAKFKDTMGSFKEVLRNWPIVLRSSIVGLVIGIVPGVGGEVAQFISYGMAKGMASDKSKFGHGEPRGVIASEASNSAKDSGALLPTICLGIPGAPEMAILLGILMIIGINPGPGMLTEHADLLWLILLASIIGNILAGIACVIGSPWLSRITTIPINYVFAVTIPLAFCATFSWNSNVWDCMMLGVFCLIGIELTRCGYPVSSLILGFVLGPLAENSFHTTLQSGHYNPAIFFQGTTAWVLVAMIAALCAWGVIRAVRRRKKEVKALQKDEPIAEAPQKRVSYKESIGVIAFLFAIAVVCMLVSPSYNLKKSGLFPFVLSIMMGFSALSALIVEVRKYLKDKANGVAYPRMESWAHYLPALIFLAGYIVAFIVSGVYAATFVGLLLFFRLIAKERWIRSLIAALAITAFMVILFVLIFKVQLWPGSMPMLIPGYLGGGSLRPFF